MNGSTNREGRVEVCMDGRWGTVCNSNPPLAGAVCSQLGFPALGINYKLLFINMGLNQRCYCYRCYCREQVWSRVCVNKKL